MKINAKKSLKNKKHDFVLPDVIIVIVMLTLVTFGCIMVYSASCYSAELTYGSGTFFLRKQIIGAIMGLAGCVFFYLFPFQINQ